MLVNKVDHNVNNVGYKVMLVIKLVNIMLVIKLVNIMLVIKLVNNVGYKVG